ncbi:tripartite motif-containing protein 16-like [Pungitius pungitius]|uniref:tripartite motif-containing protein 16-like n=1 Tax=Pungitius pungitius TaxID=134920 RepID=UPI002E127578
MAEVTPQLLETIDCSVCLDVLKDPVTIPCGHSYCMRCINNCWNMDNKRRIPCCPDCREIYTVRPDLVKNTTLANLVEQLNAVQPAAADPCYAEPKDVACDFCTGRKLKAFKSCLVCLASYCEKHLLPHYDVAALKHHNLLDPSKKLQDNLCSLHGEVMKIFCRTDQHSICYLCFMDEHKDHDTVSAAAERTERQRKLEVSRLNIQQRIQDREEGVKLLRQEEEKINKAVKDSDDIFIELMLFTGEKSSIVKAKVKSQDSIEDRQSVALQEKLQQEISELKRRDTELQELSHTGNLNQFLQNYPSGSPLSDSTDSFSINIRPPSCFEAFTRVLLEIRDKLEDVLKEKWTNVFLTVAEVEALLSQSEPNTRAGFLKHSLTIPLDPNTAHTELSLSDGNKKAALGRQKQPYCCHPDRFCECEQVLSRESLVNRCYWEVEWRGEVVVAVAYKDISRKGDCDEVTFGLNDKSWALTCAKSNYIFRHNRIVTPISGPVSSRVGVYLDHTAGLLSFYSVSETMTLLHRVHTTFTQPLYAGIQLVNCGDTAEFK